MAALAQAVLAQRADVPATRALVTLSNLDLSLGLLHLTGDKIDASNDAELGHVDTAGMHGLNNSLGGDDAHARLLTLGDGLLRENGLEGLLHGVAHKVGRIPSGSKLGSLFGAHGSVVPIEQGGVLLTLAHGLGQVAENLVARKGKNGLQIVQEHREDLSQNRLGAAALDARGRAAVRAVLHDVHIHVGKLGHDIVVERAIDLVEAIARVGLLNLGMNGTHPGKGNGVDSQKRKQLRKRR